mgnify:CR=1 FL=1
MSSKKQTKTMKQLKAQKKKSETPDTKSKDKEIAELKQKVKQLEKAQKGRKLSALNRFKKYIVGPLTELALAETEYVDLIPLDKMRLLNKAYPIVWQEMVVNKVSMDNINSRKLQVEFNNQVDEILEQMKAGELDDQEHYREDIVNLLRNAIDEAAKSFEQEYDDEDGEEETEE